MNSKLKLNNEELIAAYPEFPELLFPKISSHLRGVEITEEFVLSKSELAEHITENCAVFIRNGKHHIAAWMHEAFEYYRSRKILLAQPKEIQFKIRTLEYKTLRIATIRRKWPSEDFLVFAPQY